MLTSGRTGQQRTCGQSQFIHEHTAGIWKGDPTPHGQEESSSTQAVCSVPTEIVCVKCWVWIRKGSIGFSNFPSGSNSWSSLQHLDVRAGSLHSSRWRAWTHKATYLAVKRRGALGLPADDGRDPSDEQQQHSHCRVHWESREHVAGQQGQGQAQDGQQENCRSHGGGEQAGLQKTKMPGPWVTPISKLPTSVRAILSPRFLLNCPKHTTLPILPNLEYSQRETPLLTKQEGTSIDNPPRFQSGDSAGREPQSPQNPWIFCFRYRL